MKHLWFLTVLHCLFFTHVYATEMNDAFRLVKHKNNIALYERWIAGSNMNKVREVRAVFTIHAATDHIIALLRDPARGAGWNKNALEYKILPVDQSNWITYLCFEIPWPFNNQDMCLHYSIKPYTTGNHNIEIAFESVLNNHFPVRKDITRTTGTQGSWLLEPQASGAVKVTYNVTTDKSMRIPRWVSDPIVHGHLFETMNTFKSLLEKE